MSRKEFHVDDNAADDATAGSDTFKGDKGDSRWSKRAKVQDK